MLSRASTDIQLWQMREGMRHDRYISWKCALINRFFHIDFEYFKYQRAQGPDETLSRYMAETLERSKLLGISAKDCKAQILRSMVAPRRESNKLINRARKIDETLLNTIEACEKKCDVTAQEEREKQAKAMVSQVDVHFRNAWRTLEEVEINGIKMNALLDSGSNINVIRADRINMAKMEAYSGSGRTANGSQLHFNGRIKATIKIGDLITAGELYVCKELTEDCILGTPFMHENQVSLHFNNAVTDDEMRIKNREARHKELLKRLCEAQNRPVLGTECTINTKEGACLYTPPQIIPQALERRIIEQIKILTEKGFIRESRSTWCNRIRPVEKDDGSVRITMNFIRLNNITQPDKYTFPRIDQIIHGLRGMQTFTKIDLKDGYFYIPLRECDRYKTAFKIKCMTYEWNVMPQGFINSAAVFQRFMDKTLEGLVGRYCYVYIDDILIFGDSERTHDEAFEEVVNRLIKAGLHGNLKKIEYRSQKI